MGAHLSVHANGSLERGAVGLGILLTVPLLFQYVQYGLTLPRDITTRNHLAVMGLLLMVSGFMTFAFTLVLHAALRWNRHDAR